MTDIAGRTHCCGMKGMKLCDDCPQNDPFAGARMNLPAVPAPDFDALRAQRNAALDEVAARLGAEGWNTGCLHHSRDACYCACTDGGPCEHDWNGVPYESPDGLEYSATCSRCGVLAMSHDLRTLP